MAGRQAQPDWRNKPNCLALDRNDVLQADRGQPAQCAHEHGLHRTRQAPLPLQCRSATDSPLRKVSGALEDAEDYKTFEAAITADCDAQSATRSFARLAMQANIA